MRILCFGDSNTYGYDPHSYFGDRYPAEDRWVDILAEKTGYDIQNEGQNGREVPSRSYERNAFQSILAESQPLDLLIVMLGSNDLLQGRSPGEAAARMEVFLDEVPLDPGQLLLIAPPPLKRGEWVTSDQLVSASIELGSRYHALAQKLGIPFADAGRWDIALAFDGVHFSESGHKAFAEGVCHILSEKESLNGC